MELYIKEFDEGYCYQVIPDKSSGKIVVHGMVRGPIELPLGELIQDKITGEWHYKGERRDHPDWSTLNQIFHRFWNRSEEHTSELQSLMRISYAVCCLKKKKQKYDTHSKNI